MKPRIVLASASKQRKILMESLDVAFEIIPPDIDEKAVRDADLKIQSEKIARAKAEAVAAREHGIVIAADTFLEFNGKVLEKPVDIQEAREMLTALSGNTAADFTGFCYIDREKNIDYSVCVVNEIIFRELTAHEVEAYTANFPVTTWAGGVSPAYPYGLSFFKSISGSPSAFSHGFPMDILIPLLEKSGVKVKPKLLKL